MSNYSVDYSLTLTLRPINYKNEPEKQYDDTYEYVRRKLLSLTERLTLVCELTKNFNIHYHAILSLPIKDGVKEDCKKKIHKAFRNDKLIGFIYVKQITDFSGWATYISKDLLVTYINLNRRPIINDYYERFDEAERAAFGVTW